MNGATPEPWRTLLFSPNPAAGKTHGGFDSPRDHLFLDFFTMPIVEPYAISEPFSTAGKVNLNYQLVPFTYITRTTGLRGVLRSTRVTAIKPTEEPKKGSSGILRKVINADETIRGFEARFNASTPSTYKGNTGPFRTASEICDMFLVPVEGGASHNNIESWWGGYTKTGDNSREAPYGHIYPRVTTKSNVYTVHMRVQTLRKAQPAASLTPSKKAEYYTEWHEDRDQVLSEYRGRLRSRDMLIGRPEHPRFCCE
jgi:uncharacterized protein (TIGR02600 family)